ncbi:MAG: hypothetical protein SFH39_15060 [Candidatus Magnetobacterium sp. LHC-1]|uniref:Phage protein n=1 Tax=Candidatus Magnetobacterium casense TaxID=1455061 RepID=A0ABS6RZ76_9BACT|nr:hypothetical protein [Candidatus Magnetobacterium casensis]MBF0607627.1 hypothetical protein [Nitrospirota bacterium]MBV6341955.1 hypothetical protein [Candidatus Magnetobacterium casensis]
MDKNTEENDLMWEEFCKKAKGATNDDQIFDYMPTEDYYKELRRIALEQAEAYERAKRYYVVRL